MEVWFRSGSFLFMGDLWVPAVDLPGVYVINESFHMANKNTDLSNWVI